jgi:hypothetical protein
MSTTTTVGPDVATRHVLVVAEAFTGRLRWAYKGRPAPSPPVPVGYVMTSDTLGQTNVHAGQGPHHPNCVLIEHPTAEPGDVLTEAEITAGIAAAKEKQALVPEQQKAREAQRQAAVAAQAQKQQALEALPAEVAALKAELAAMKEAAVAKPA